MKDCPFSFQHVVVQDAEQYRTMECHDNCQPYQWFDPEEACPRIQMLFRQESWVAKDEMDFYIDVFTSTGLAQGHTTLVFDDFPDQLEQWIQQCSNAATTDKTTVSAVLLDQHWIPFAFVHSGNDHVKVVTSKEGAELLSYCNHPEVPQIIPLPHLFKADCGFQTIGWLARLVLDPSSSFGPKHFGDLFPPITVAAAASWRGMFEHHLFVTSNAPKTVVPSCIRIGGVKGDIVEAQLQDMLQEHAVPSEQCKSRADMIIEKLGRTAVTKALRANRPWVELKSLANGMTPKIQIVLPSELPEAIKKRAAEGRVVGDKARKKHSSTHDPIPVQLHPSDLTIPDGVFKQGNDMLIRQIQLSSIGKSSQGVVIVNAAQAGPYLHLSKPVSSEGLGLLVLDHQDSAVQGVGQVIQFPAKFEKSGEPLITRARLIQLGTAEVSRHVPQHLHCVDEVKTAVLRALVFRDELECSWEDFVQHPVKYILQHSSPLIGGSSPESNVLDVWDRQFVGLKLDKLPPKRAEIYIVSFRVTNIDVKTILDLSGHHAIYFEPRDDVGRQPHGDYRVVWIPRTDKSSVLASVQLAEHWTCLARSGNKFGIRTATQHAQELHEAHKPAVPFLEASSLTTFIVGPMPYGATRSSLVKLFGQWEWKARPCQPRGRSADGNGVLWECQASEPPQFEIYTMKHADVLVSPVEKKKPGTRPSNDIVASAKTIAILKQQNGKSNTGPPVDPLQTHDPWQAYSTPPKQAKVGFNDGPNFQPGHGGTNIDTINRVVEQKLEAKFAQMGRNHPNGEDADMGDTHDARITEMEHRLSSLESVVQSNQVQQVQHQSQVTAQISSLQQRADTQGSALQRHMDEKLNEQLSHIERLLGRGDKKARGEWLSSKDSAREGCNLGSGEGACPRDRCCPTSRMREHPSLQSPVQISNDCSNVPVMSAGTKFPKTSRSTPVVSTPQSFAYVALVKQKRSCTQGPFTRKSRVTPFATSVWVRVLLNYIILMCCFRFGEAQNPGPTEGSEPLIGTFNPSGLLGKGQSAVSLPAVAWGVTETHLSAQGLIQFRDELKYLRSSSRFLAGAPAPPLSNSLSCIGGKATGVGLFSSFPSRTLPCTWPKHLQETARIHAGAICCDNNWIRIGTFYGYAKAPKSIITQNKSDELLELLTDRIVHDSRGFRVICGDFNQDIRTLTQTEEWSRLGFVEIQEYAWLKWGRPIQPTSKGQNVRDYIWVSPELIPWIKSVHVDDTWFADHAVLYAKFHPLGKISPVPIWKKPCPIPWEECEVDDPQDIDQTFVEKASQGSPDQRLETIMDFVEQSADGALRKRGKPGLLRNQRGRKSTKEVTRGRFPTVPLKIDRGKVCDPTFTGEHFQHYLWLRQLRRLNSCVRLISTGLTNCTKIDHAVSLWESVKRAQGFPQGFMKWWPTRSIVWADSPTNIPEGLPSTFQIDLIFQNYKAEFQHLEQLLKTHRVRQAREARLKDPSRVYRDIARPQAVPVQTLVSQISAVVDSSSSDHLIITYPKGSLDTNEPVFGPQGIVRTSSHSPGHIELVEDQGLGVGDLLTQPRMCGTVESVFAEFEKHWGTIWNKHSSIPESQWKSFIDKALVVIPTPNRPCTVEPITVEEWTSAVRHKKVHSATGPDGIARTDLLFMPHQCKVQLVQLINDIEAGLAWPSQLQVGLVSALEKRESAQTVADYRPICILSFVYRVWSSIRTKQILKWLDSITPDSLIGSRPHKEAAHVWFHLASLVEDVSNDNQTITGLSVDIQRCFNELPRTPVFAIATAMQIPACVRIPWQKGLIQLERRFAVSGATGPPIRSNSGFTEGDPLSVVAMYLVNLVMTASITQDCPKVIPWSYVDDWQFTAPTAEDTLEGFHKVKEFTDSLQVQLDLKKCFVWGTTAESRASLRASDLPVKLHARNLGGHLAYSKVSTNYTIVDRIRGCGFFWKKLKRSVASTTQKTLALQVAAWPKCLHGIAGVFLKAVQALGFDRPGTNPHLQLSGLMTPTADPEYHAIAITIRSFRRFCVPDNAFPMLGYLTQVSPVRFLPGPCGIFLMRIFALGWQWLSDGWIRDHKGFVFHLIKAPIQLLENRITDAWLHRVASTVAVREGFTGFEHCDFAISTERYNHLESEHQGLLRTVMNGSFFTRNKQLASGNFVDSTCPWCDQVDSIHHRHWECEFFQDCRNCIPQEVFAQLDSLDPCTIEHGWFKTSEAFAEFQYLFCPRRRISATRSSVLTTWAITSIFSRMVAVWPQRVQPYVWHHGKLWVLCLKEKPPTSIQLLKGHSLVSYRPFFVQKHTQPWRP